MTSSKSPAKRADATRNRERILDAARAAFADPTVQVSMAEVARRAGVGMATLYRNFPGRQELLEALYRDEVDTVVAAASSVTGATAGARLEAWLLAFFAFYRGKHHVGDELLAAPEVDGHGILDAGRTRVVAAGQGLLDAAQSAGDVRPELTLEQVLDLVIAVAKIPGSADYVQPILVSAIAGLRTTAH